MNLCSFGSALGAGERDDEASRARRRTPVVEVFEASRDAVVNISATEVVTVSDPFDRLFEGFFDRPSRPRTREYKRTSVGSGFVIHPSGYIVTNAHVVARAADTTVTFSDGSEFQTQVIASDRDQDIAVLKVEAPRPLPTLRFGHSDGLMIGETVIAIGNPYGYQNTVTAGVVSAVGRDLEFGEDIVLRDLLQTDASINPGHSGGPLLNVAGELIGVNTAIRGDAENIGFAIPVDRLRALLPELLDVERRYNIDSGLMLATSSALRVRDVKPGSAAAAAGVRPDDLVKAIDGRPLAEPVDFHIALIGRSPGDEVTLQLDRGGQRLSAAIKLRERPRPDVARLAFERVGLSVTALPADIARELRLPRQAGLVVVAVEPASPAAEAGIHPRDVLVSVGVYHPTTLEELGQLLEHVQAGDMVSVSYLRVRPPEIVRYRATLRAR